MRSKENPRRTGSGVDRDLKRLKQRAAETSNGDAWCRFARRRRGEGDGDILQRQVEEAKVAQPCLEVFGGASDADRPPHACLGHSEDFRVLDHQVMRKGDMVICPGIQNHDGTTCAGEVDLDGGKSVDKTNGDSVRISRRFESGGIVKRQATGLVINGKGESTQRPESENPVDGYAERFLKTIEIKRRKIGVAVDDVAELHRPGPSEYEIFRPSDTGGDRLSGGGQFQAGGDSLADHVECAARIEKKEPDVGSVNGSRGKEHALVPP